MSTADADDHSADPKRLIEQAFEMGAEFPGPAEDLLLSWMLSLAVDADAPAIAARLAVRYRPALDSALETLGDQGANHPIARLHLLLEQTATAGAERGRGRRGGRRSRGEGGAQ